MRSLLLSRLGRLCLRKPPALGIRHLGGVRFLSETPLYRIVRADPCGSTPRDGDIGRLVVRVVNGPEEEDKVLEKTVPMDLMTETGTIGASHGWVATLKNGVVRIQDDLNPNASDSDPKRISLPPLVTLPYCQTQVVTNVAMSSSSPEDEDCIVAVKFLGSQLSLCRPAQKGKDTKWVNYRMTEPGFFSSRVMHSEKDKMFSMVVSGGTHMGSWDYLGKHVTHDLEFPGYEEFTQSKWSGVSMHCRSEHLVVSPITGELLMVKWYTESLFNTGMARWTRFLVFRILNNEYSLVERDIGDVCIFLSPKGESFCLQASLYGLTPNSIYYVNGDEFGRVNVSDNVRIGEHLTSLAPYFIPPQP